MKKIKISMVALLVMVICSAYSQDNSKKSTLAEGKTIDEIIIRAHINTYIYNSQDIKNSRVEIISKKGDLSIFEYEVIDGEFEIKYTEEHKEDLNDMSSKQRERYLKEMKENVTVNIYTTNFKLLKASLSSDIYIKDNFNYKNLSLRSTTSGKIHFNNSDINVAGDMEISTSTSGSLCLDNISAENNIDIKASTSGKFEVFDIKAGGDITIIAATSGRIKVSDIITIKDVKAKSSTSGSILIDCLEIEKGLFYGQSSTSGDIKVNSGNVKNNDSYNSLICSTSGDVNCEGLNINKAKVSASTSGDIYVNVSKELRIINVSTGGDVHYTKKDPMFFIIGGEIKNLNAIN